MRLYLIQIGNLQLPLNFQDFDQEQGTFLDSGTTMVYFHSKIYKFILN